MIVYLYLGLNFSLMNLLQQNIQTNFTPNLEQQFDFQFNAKIPEFSTQFADAIECKSRQSKNPDDKYYAMIFKKEYPVNFSKLGFLKEIKIKVVQELIDYGKIKNLQGKEVLVAIFRKPEGVPLLKFLSESGELTDILVTSNILNQLFAGIVALHQYGITHGKINLDNIYIKTEGLAITIREPISEYCGFSQKAAFETYERMVCHPAGKNDLEPKADFYALGMTLVSMIIGEEIFTGITEDIIKKMKFENGSYESAMAIINSRKQIKLSQKNENLLKGLLHDKFSERWGDEEIKKWQKRETLPSVLSRLHRQSSNGFMFDEQEYFSAKYLAYEIQKNWVGAKKALKIPDLSRWISFTSKFPDVEKRFFLMTRGWQSEVVIPDEKLSRILNLLDEEGPIRMRGTAFHPRVVGNIFSYFLHEDNKEGLEDIFTVFDLGLIEGWIAQQDDADDYKPTILGWNPKKIKHYLRKKETCFGVERCAYELNYYLACKSPLLDSFYSVGLQNTLKDLEKAKLPANEPLDKHLLAYLATYCEVEDTIKIKSLSNYPDFANLDEVKLCALFSLAQTTANIDIMPNTSRWLRDKLNNLISKIHSAKNRINYEESLNKIVATANISKMFAAVIDTKLIKKDRIGFAHAKRQYKIVNFEMFRLRSRSNMDQIAYKLGLRAAVIFSYLISAISILTIMMLTVN